MYSRAYFFDESSSQHASVCIEANRTIRKRIVYRIVAAVNWLYLQLAACNLLDRIQCVLVFIYTKVLYKNYTIEKVSKNASLIAIYTLYRSS